jgi:hypothetical protein
MEAAGVPSTTSSACLAKIFMVSSEVRLARVD